jgi:polysaccharide chain length determinant protein (PEP-CTERM system associated)
MVRRRFWHILLPTLAVSIAVWWVVYKLPNIYESKTVLTIKPPTISQTIVKPLSVEDLSQRLATMKSEVLSRSSLEPMIKKYNLFQIEIANGLPMEIIIDRMRKNIDVEPEKSDNEKVAAFRIAYKDKDPQSTRAVAAELASKFVNQQIQTSINVSEATKTFLDERMTGAKTQLDEIEKERLAIMTQNIETLPESSGGLIAQLDGLTKKRDSLAKEKDSLISERGRLNDNLQNTSRQMQLVESYGQDDAKKGVKAASDYTRSPAYAEMLKKKTELGGKLQNLLKQYKEKHPDVVATRNELAEVEERLKELKVASDEIAGDAALDIITKAERQKKALEIEKAGIEAKLQRNEREIEQKDSEIAVTEGQSRELEGRLNLVPNVRVALEEINNRYQTAKTSYEDLMKKRQDAESQLQVESNAQGETIQVVDPANVPQAPVAPKKAMLTAGGVGIGLFVGLLLAALLEFPRMFTIQNLDDAKHYTNLPVLASVPPLLSQGELAWQKRFGYLRVLIGLAAAAGSVPLLILTLQTSRLFDRFVS